MADTKLRVDMSAHLRAAIEKLYEVFSAYGPDTLHQSCPCCVHEEHVAQLRATPLRQLNATQLSYYAWKAMTTFGKVTDWKYFLPRLCEVIATANFPANVEVVLGSKLAYAEFPRWPAHEQTAVLTYLYAAWDDTLRCWPAILWVAELLNCFGRVGDALDRALETWERQCALKRTARIHLANWMGFGRGSHFEKIPAFWGECAESWSKVVAWTQRESMAPLIEAAFVDWNALPDSER